MKVGDMGILQNITSKGIVFNETPAEIIQGVGAGELINRRADHVCQHVNGENDFRFVVKLIDGKWMLILPENIRPITDPDADIERTTEKELIE